MDTLFFVVSKLIWALIRPETWLVLALAVIVLTLGRRPAIARAVAVATLSATLVIGLVPVGQALIRGLESRYPSDPPLGRVDGIVVLGGAEEVAAALSSGQPEVNGASERIMAAAALAIAHPDARLILSGGSGALGGDASAQREADIAGRILASLGIAPDRIAREERSRNTAENAAFSLPMAAPAAGEVWVLVTSAWHMPRAMDSFARAGWPEMVPWPVDHRGERPGDGLQWNLAENLTVLNILGKEWVGRIAYSLTGR